MYTFSAIKTHKKIIKKESSHIFFKQNEFKINLKLFKRDIHLNKH